MPPAYWMITNREIEDDGFGSQIASDVTYWTCQNGKLDTFSNWRKLTRDEFRDRLVATADAFPQITDPALQESQKHITLFIHGYNNTWDDAARRYLSICKSLFSGTQGMGTCVLFNWPSDGMPTNYLPDREDARASAQHLAEVLSDLYDWLCKKQISAAEDPQQACKAKTSIIAHSMGNYVLQNAMQVVWTRKNQPLLVSLVNQLLMVAGDVDNDLFNSGESIDKSDGDAIANLTYRITAIYSGRDTVLGMSAGLKHFGKRRLGRSGLDDPEAVPDNVWQVDCSSFFPGSERDIHSAYFKYPKSLELMRRVLRGVDRGVIGGGL